MMFQGLEWVSMVLVLWTLHALGKGRMKEGFIVQIASAITWAIVGIHASLWGLLALQFGIAFLGFQGLWRLRRG